MRLFGAAANCATIILLWLVAGSEGVRVTRSDGKAHQSVSHMGLTRLRQLHRPRCHRGYDYEFLSYTPSSWEDRWFTNLAELKDQVCAVMKEEGDLAGAWIDAAARFSANPSAGPGELLGEGGIFSHFALKNRCDKDEPVLRVPIEPLVGLMRHPFAIPQCVPEGRQGVSVEDRSYLAMQAYAPEVFQRLYPGHKYLLDLGTAAFPTSLGWFTQQYAARGVVFDEIWAWEAKQKVNHEQYWQSVPQDVQPRLHFYNMPVADNFELFSNPWSILFSKYQPGDFVVVKLDIDNDPLENAFVAQLDGDDELRGMVAEMFFEKHYAAPEMAPFFGLPEATLPQAHAVLRGLREKGLILHYWP